MGGEFGRRCKTRLRQMLRRWRTRMLLPPTSGAPPDVPRGHVAVCVGGSSRRFVVRAAHLNDPVFRDLLKRAEEEYGFANVGPLSIPCEESAFEEIVRQISSSSKFTNLDVFKIPSCCCCHVARRRSWRSESSLLLLRGSA